jgi:hypothetical protein
MATAALTTQGIGGVGQAFGAYYQAQGQKTALKLQARMAEINAQIAQGQARDALMRGERQEQGSRMQAAQLKSSQRAAMAASGIDLGSETSAAILTSTDYLSEMEANTIKANALREAWGYRMEAVGQRGEAGMARATARGISPVGEGLTSLLTSASTVAGNYATFSSLGAFGKGSKGSLAQSGSSTRSADKSARSAAKALLGKGS